MKFNVVFKKEAKGYSVSCPALPGCHSQGETKKESLENIKEAIELYVETLNAKARATESSSVSSVTV